MSIVNPSRPSARMIRRIAGASGVVGLAALLSAGSAGAASPCFEVSGHYTEHLATDGCTSPVGLCIAVAYSGDVSGNAFGTATSFLPTIDSSTTGVVGFTSDSVIQARVRTRTGSLVIKNAGMFEQGGDGNIVDDQVIVGGTGGLTGASGVIRASGTFSSVTGSGASEYEGKVCLPR